MHIRHLLVLFHPHTHIYVAYFSYLLYFLLLLAPNGVNIHSATISTDKRETSFLQLQASSLPQIFRRTQEKVFPSPTGYKPLLHLIAELL